MTPSQIITTVATHLGTLGGWGTAPSAIWFPDFERSAIKGEGLSAKVFLPERTLLREARGQIRSNSPTVHVAIHDQVQTGNYAEGAAVVDKADAVAVSLLNNPLDVGGHTLFGTQAEHKPTIDHDHASQYGLWLSYLIISYRVGG